MSSRNCISYWFPRLEVAGVPVPRTRIVRTDVNLQELFDAGNPPGLAEFYGQLRAAAAEFGYPVFLRTGHGSGKHDWRRTCYVPDESSLPMHVFNLVEWSCLVDVMGLPYDVWAVREFLELDVAMILPRYEDMPLAREFRFFVGEGRIRCFHPYWPARAVRDGEPEEPGWEAKLAEISKLAGKDKDEAFRLALQVAEAFNGNGSWSVDVCKTKDGRWLVTDMAVAERSWHWPDCPLRKTLEPNFDSLLEE